MEQRGWPGFKFTCGKADDRFAARETRGERCSGLCITMQIDCKQVPNLGVVQNKPELIKAGRTSERNTAVTVNKYLLQSHIQKSCLLFCKSAC